MGGKDARDGHPPRRARTDWIRTYWNAIEMIRILVMTGLMM
jgi:hypothetical protein